MLTANIEKLQSEIPNNVQVVLATKYANPTDIAEISAAYPAIIFGENRVQHGQENQAANPNIQNPWHFIGHLQRNKVKKVLQNYSCIQSVDSIRLIEEINSTALKLNQTAEILLQVDLMNQDTKFGFTEEEAYHVSELLPNMSNLKVKGLMCMAPHTDNTKEIKKTFASTKALYDRLKSDGLQMEILSMGMSNDYKIAIEEGSNMIRVGSIIFK
ncbi:MAG: YggS family pyridoxal phosphate-dependent enzyme [Candidatus Marinamargulisbacteria bacterium]